MMAMGSERRIVMIASMTAFDPRPASSPMPLQEGVVRPAAAGARNGRGGICVNTVSPAISAPRSRCWFEYEPGKNRSLRFPNAAADGEEGLDAMTCS